MMQQHQTLREQQGFTLIEVLVAMTILAVGVTALVSASGAAAWRSDFLRNREIGRWVAANRLTELTVLPAWEEVGTKNTEVEMGGRTWYVRTYIYVVTGFVGNPEHRR